LVTSPTLAIGWEKVGVLVVWGTAGRVFVTPGWMAARVGLAIGVVASRAACTVNAAAVAICGSIALLVGILHEEMITPNARVIIKIFFMVFLCSYSAVHKTGFRKLDCKEINYAAPELTGIIRMSSKIFTCCNYLIFL
jgi:hypothetical protein